MRIFILSLVLGLFSLETMALSCDITNYQDYIRNRELTSKLIKETGIGCILTKAYLAKADLWRAELAGADLRGATLWKANLQGADLRGADLQGANLQQANLRGADLQEAHLKGANLWRADLRGADLQKADLQEADLRGADLAGTFESGARFENAIYNGKTDLPGVNYWFKKEHNVIYKN